MQEIRFRLSEGKWIWERLDDVLKKFFFFPTWNLRWNWDMATKNPIRHHKRTAEGELEIFTDPEVLSGEYDWVWKIIWWHVCVRECHYTRSLLSLLVITVILLYEFQMEEWWALRVIYMIWNWNATVVIDFTNESMVECNDGWLFFEDCLDGLVDVVWRFCSIRICGRNWRVRLRNWGSLSIWMKWSIELDGDSGQVHFYWKGGRILQVDF